MYVFDYLRFSFKIQDLLGGSRSYGNEKPRKNVKCVHIIKCTKVRALFAKNKVRFAHAEQLCVQLSTSYTDRVCHSTTSSQTDRRHYDAHTRLSSQLPALLHNLGEAYNGLLALHNAVEAYCLVFV